MSGTESYNKNTHTRRQRDTRSVRGDNETQVGWNYSKGRKPEFQKDAKASSASDYAAHSAVSSLIIHSVLLPWKRSMRVEITMSLTLSLQSGALHKQHDK